jgi:hypothetical protein
MDNNELRKLLHQIQDEIKKTRTVDEKNSQLLHDLDADTRALLENLGEEPPQVHPSIVLRLETGLSHFEVDHPNLTLLISKLLDTLSNTGI